MLDKVRSHGNVSFVELVRAYEQVEGESSARGNLAIEMANCPNLVVWMGVNESFVSALDEIRPFTDMKPCHFLVYLVDGGALTLPIAKRPPKGGYHKPRWVPVVLNMRHPE